MRQIFIMLAVFSTLFFTACEEKPLPFFGERTLEGAAYTVPEFSFLNQDSLVIDKQLVKGKVYIVDFFFTKCPTICPRVKANVLKINEHYKGQKDFLILSHSIDTKNDSIPVLKNYAQKLGVEDGDNWHFVTGEKYEIYDMANSYFISALESEDAPGGFDHSGKVILVDRQGRIRSFFDGTDANEVGRFINDIQTIIDEKE